ncbi:MAG: hypothetical protein U0547_05825 [Dehalococcoidia bacterium]
MRQCPWCGRMNLNVYAYCQSCGRGFEGPEQKPASQANKRGWWPFGKKSA